MKAQKAKKILRGYLKNSNEQDDEILIERFYQNLYNTDELDKGGQELQAAGERMQVNIMAKINGNSSRTRKLIPFLSRSRYSASIFKGLYRYGAAAAVLLVFAVLSYFYLGGRDSFKGLNLQQDIALKEIGPGRNGATLTLASGRKISIDEALSGNILTEDGIKIYKNRKGQIVYEVTANANDAGGFNTLSTTKGEQTQVLLSDGTVVFLNAESALRYPTNLSKSKKREVSLTGEGYFEVAKRKHIPFIVNAKEQQVQVLGTHFNISAYGDETTTKTTLIEGSVRANGFLLFPNEQLVSDSESKQTKKITINPDLVTDWKDGVTVFDKDIRSIMKQIARWYKVEVTYQGNITQEEFGGKISRSKSLNDVLKALQDTKKVSFRIENTKQPDLTAKVVVMP